MADEVNCLGSYDNFLKKFIEKGYRFIKFQEHTSTQGELILRHDIDFDVKFAHQASLVETSLGIKSTYFFLLRSDFYNPFSKENFDLIMDIRSRGHDISIHYDPTIYEDFNEGFAEEHSFFRSVFNTDVKIISLHRPNDFFLKLDQRIANIEHTYQTRYFKDIKYFADSTGKWRFGSPLDSEEFQKMQSIHLLIHPVWWFLEGKDNLEVLKNCYRKKTGDLKTHFNANSIPFREVSDYV